MKALARTDVKETPKKRQHFGFELGVAGPGRPKGLPNKATQSLKTAIMLAAQNSGYDTKGKDGLNGYLKRVADTDVKSFVSLLGKVLPIELSGPNGGPIELTIEALLQRVAENHLAIHSKVIEHKPEEDEL